MDLKLGTTTPSDIQLELLEEKNSPRAVVKDPRRCLTRQMQPTPRSGAADWQRYAPE